MQKLVHRIAALGLVLFAFLIVSPSWVRADPPKLWIEHNGGFGGEFITDGKTKARQSFFGLFHLEDLVKDNPNAKLLAEKQSQAETSAHLAYWIGLVPSTGVLAYGLVSGNTAVSVISGVTFLVSGILTGHFASQARHYMFEAINEVNGVRKAQAAHQEGRMKSPFEGDSIASAPTLSVNFQF
jgi:hypothetical protein